MRAEDVIFNHLIHTASIIAGRHAAHVQANGGDRLAAYRRAFEHVLARFIAL